MSALEAIVEVPSTCLRGGWALDPDRPVVLFL